MAPAAVTVGTIGTAALLVLTPTYLPLILGIIAAGFALNIVLSGRSVPPSYFRLTDDSTTRGASSSNRPCEAGEEFVHLIAGTLNTPYCAVGFVADDPCHKLPQPCGVRVIGGEGQLVSIPLKTEASTLVVAIAGVGPARSLELDRHGRTLSFVLRSILISAEVPGGFVTFCDFSDVTGEDPPGHKLDQVDETVIEAIFKGIRVLITGDYGLKGTEIVSQVHRHVRALVGILDHKDSALQQMPLNNDGKGCPVSDDLPFADAPYAADLIHIPCQSKKVTARATGCARRPFYGHHVSLPYENALRPVGSVFQTSRHQITASSPVTLTCSDVARDTMIITEAVQSALQVAAVKVRCETVPLYRGELVGISDVIALLVEKSSSNLENVLTGPGLSAKVWEFLAGENEYPEFGIHPFIPNIRVDPLLGFDLDYLSMSDWSIVAWREMACQWS